MRTASAIGRRSVRRASLSAFYQKRQTEIAERRFFPEAIRRKETLLADMIDDYLKRVEGKLAWFDHYQRYGRLWKEALAGGR